MANMLQTLTILYVFEENVFLELVIFTVSLLLEYNRTFQALQKLSMICNDNVFLLKNLKAQEHHQFQNHQRPRFGKQVLRNQ